MNRQQHLQKRVQKMLDAYVDRHHRIPKITIIGYNVYSVTEEVPSWATK